MREADARLLGESFKGYYFGHFGDVPAPDRAAQREFGYQRFGSGMVRHVGLADSNALRLMIMENCPSDVYCSSGYYSFPELPMADKDWRGADLVFDVDSKDLALPCREGHTARLCGGCGRAEPAGAAACGRCGSERHELRPLPCARCVAGAKAEVAKLLRILDEDLGVPAASAEVYFSGNEGFHVHARGTPYEGLGPRERGEIADYVSFRGAVPEAMGMRRSGAKAAELCDAGERGWRGRAAAALFGSASGRRKAAPAIVKAGYREFAGRLEELAPRAGAVIDHAVTTDIHRIFRLPGSLSGKSGLAKAPCGDLAGFDPYRDACLIGGDPVAVVADAPLKFSLGGKGFGPYSAEAVEVPRFAAAYMVCKGLASAA